MLFIKVLFLNVLLIINNDVRASDLHVNDDCKTDTGENGICLDINHCPTAQELVKKRVQSKICNFQGKVPIVCCKKRTDQLTESIGGISRQKCAEYKIKNMPTTTTTTTTTPKPGEFPKWTIIIGGQNADPLEFPHMAVLGHGTDNDLHWQCGGSLISENFVLTAAHCINSRYGKVHRINLGVHQLSFIQDIYLQSFYVKNTFKHPNYVFGQDYNDIALIELDGKANIQRRVKPACLHTEKGIPSNSFVATGWGATELHGDNSDILQKVFLNFVPYDNCTKSYKPSRKLQNGIDDETQLCADGGGQKADTCQGDSGGPLHLNPPDTLFTVIGVTSFGIKCALVPAVYTRVSNYIPWIESIVWPN